MLFATQCRERRLRRKRINTEQRSHGAQTEKNQHERRRRDFPVGLPAHSGRPMDREGRDHKRGHRSREALVIRALSIHVAREARSRHYEVKLRDTPLLRYSV
jgi:hypothetical protein